MIKDSKIGGISQLFFKSLELKQRFIGICNLCYRKQFPHQTRNCQFSTILYHATERKYLQSIINHGLHGHKGRLGVAIYCSDDPKMCIKYVEIQRLTKKFKDPILLKIKFMITNIFELQKVSQKLSILQYKNQYDCVRCLYFVQQNLYEWAVLNQHDYQILEYAEIEKLSNKPSLQIQKFRQQFKQQLGQQFNQKLRQQFNQQFRQQSCFSFYQENNIKYHDQKPNQYRNSRRTNRFKQMYAIETITRKHDNRPSRYSSSQQQNKTGNIKDYLQEAKQTKMFNFQQICHKDDNQSQIYCQLQLRGL